MTPRVDLREVLAELNAVHDECELATWFAMPHPALSGRSPAQAMETEVASVVRIARIARFLATS